MFSKARDQADTLIKIHVGLPERQRIEGVGWESSGCLRLETCFWERAHTQGPLPCSGSQVLRPSPSPNPAFFALSVPVSPSSPFAALRCLPGMPSGTFRDLPGPSGAYPHGLFPLFIRSLLTYHLIPSPTSFSRNLYICFPLYFSAYTRPCRQINTIQIIYIQNIVEYTNSPQSSVRSGFLEVN